MCSIKGKHIRIKRAIVWLLFTCKIYFVHIMSEQSASMREKRASDLALSGRGERTQRCCLFCSYHSSTATHTQHRQGPFTHYLVLLPCFGPLNFVQHPGAWSSPRHKESLWHSINPATENQVTENDSPYQYNHNQVPSGQIQHHASSLLAENRET